MNAVAPSAPSGPLRWMRRHLFGGWFNTLLALAALALLLVVVPALWRWAITDSRTAPAEYKACVDAGGACWAYLQAKWRLILFGTYPYAEQWRPALAMGLFIGAVVASCVPALWTSGRRRWGMAALWFSVAIGVAVLMSGGTLGLTRVEHRLWAGAPLTLGLAVVGCVSAFTAAVLLALGRRSEMPLVRWLAIGYIEFIRGVPLVSLLFLATILFPLVVPPDVDVDKLVRAQLAFAMFFAAYMAEAIRGGLQAVPAGQVAAAHAIGLGYWRTHLYVVLPQALRHALPSLVNIFIAAFKDTSLVTIVAMMDLLGTANAAKSDPAWWGLYIESYLFIAAIYFVACAGMSWYARRLERRLAGAPRGAAAGAGAVPLAEAAVRP
jgi:general L-amino acid transport system permease protein